MEIQRNCTCGKEHVFTSEIVVGEGVLKQIPDMLKKYHATKVFLVADQNTYSAAGKAVEEMVKEEMTVQSYIFRKDFLEPDEKNVGLAMMYYETDCDVIIGVGSGVINDICKIVANVSDKPYIIVATAPSMDGYASSTSSVVRDGLKVSLPSKCADIIVGDIEILRKAPMKLLISGLGDMLAKYVSICEWRISNLINGEYYCEEIAKLVRTSLKCCVDHADGVLQRDKESVLAVFEGLVLCGAAMKYAGVSRPASGCEHYMSHVWDMRGIEFAIPVELHGIQCGMATRMMVQMYEKLIATSPDREKALNYVEAFDYEKWSETLRDFLGEAAESMIVLESKEKKYDKESHRGRLEIILQHWNEILDIIREELPTVEQLEPVFDKIGIPKTFKEIGVDEAILPLTFKATKDIRDKYVLSRLCWDLGIIDEMI